VNEKGLLHSSPVPLGFSIDDRTAFPVNPMCVLVQQISVHLVTMALCLWTTT